MKTIKTIRTIHISFGSGDEDDEDDRRTNKFVAIFWTVAIPVIIGLVVTLKVLGF